MWAFVFLIKHLIIAKTQKINFFRSQDASWKENQKTRPILLHLSTERWKSQKETIGQKESLHQRLLPDGPSSHQILLFQSNLWTFWGTFYFCYFMLSFFFRILFLWKKMESSSRSLPFSITVWITEISKSPSSSIKNLSPSLLKNVKILIFLIGNLTKFGFVLSIF